jgi:hypothetical protein
MISRRSGSAGVGVASTTRCSGNERVGWKLTRKMAVGGWKNMSIHRVKHAGKSSGTKYLPARSTVEPCKSTMARPVRNHSPAAGSRIIIGQRAIDLIRV